ncbi:hypothetical protein Osc1_17890 [Hominimerdicola sp. 21CYCFAH17_S]
MTAVSLMILRMIADDNLAGLTKTFKILLTDNVKPLTMSGLYAMIFKV